MRFCTLMNNAEINAKRLFKTSATLNIDNGMLRQTTQIARISKYATYASLIHDSEEVGLEIK